MSATSWMVFGGFDRQRSGDALATPERLQISDIDIPIARPSSLILSSYSLNTLSNVFIFGSDSE